MSNRPSDGDDAVDAYGIPAFCKRHDRAQNPAPVTNPSRSGAFDRQSHRE